MARYYSILGCISSTLPVVYLGLPLHFKKASYRDWAPVLDKITPKLNTWKTNYLYMGGRLILINSVLSAIPTYYLSVLHLPKRVELEIDCIRRRFLWKTQASPQFGYCLAKWTNICRSKSQDGLGIINLSNFNLALKCKLLWNLLSSNLCIKWPSLVKSRFYAQNNLRALLNMAPNGASPIWKELKRCFPIVNMLSSFSLRDGKNIIF